MISNIAELIMIKVRKNQNQEKFGEYLLEI